ncbi:hypothetical protein [Pseudoalteromonas sp. NC201]|uniref:hypothetical protein n=1 Tax=Pseudoalteromonas sp. NC201 TaxID=1514074 RepID=UPI000C7BE418|nr:hypothetical protein [Pseudoalteromonas sp. NC201]AUJ71880.1 hypothetical protein PNC201_18315 [Pseudoalteromonas sp. NC201]
MSSKVCKFCEKSPAIDNSHLIPSFIYKWIKDTSPTGYMRATNEPNKRQQDGYKSALLCESCEEKFSKSEDLFKKELFNKIANYRKPCPEKLSITNNIRTCLYIIAWRVLADAYHFPKENDYTDDEINEFPNFIADMKSAINSGTTDKFKTHIIPCTKDVLTQLGLPKVDWYFYDRMTGAEPRIWDNWERFIIFIKIPSAIVAFEVVPNDNDDWSGTQIDKVESISLSKIKSIPSYISDLVSFFHRAFVASKGEVTELQQEKMKNDILAGDLECGAIKSLNKTW